MEKCGKVWKSVEKCGKVWKSVEKYEKLEQEAFRPESSAV